MANLDGDRPQREARVRALLKRLPDSPLVIIHPAESTEAEIEALCRRHRMTHRGLLIVLPDNGRGYESNPVLTRELHEYVDSLTTQELGG